MILSHLQIANNRDLQTTEATTKRIGKTNWCKTNWCKTMWAMSTNGK